MDKKDVYFEKLEAQLREWDATWEVAKARLAKRTADMKLEGLELLKRWESTHAEAREKATKLKQSADANWESFKEHAEEILSRLGSATALVREKVESWKDGPDKAPEPPAK
jgi:hypothetical protein